LADLEIRDLHVRIEEREILRGVDLDSVARRAARADGPERLGQVDAREHDLGHPSYEVTEGRSLFKGEDITELRTARAGQGGACSSPSSTRSPIPGVSVANFLRMAINAKREEPIKVKEFRTSCSTRSSCSTSTKRFTSRHLNDGFSGGEKKRAEILQMAMLARRRGDPRRDRLGPRHRRAADGRRGRAAAARRAGLGALIITHYQRILHYVKPQFVHILMDGRIVHGGRRRARRAPGARGL
jgi:Fe-S cluster assembly ATP-binding protein